MTQSVSKIETEKASRYLQQLSKHFAHKVSVAFDAHNARLDMPFGPCELAADDTALTLRLDCAPDKIDLAEKVMEDHLVRFAFREDLSINWQRSEA